jgi:anti-sigma regulatory factor (Ser/Thr protein kinase)
MRVPAAPQYRQVVAIAVLEIARQSGLSEREAADVASAASEAFDNTAVHAYTRLRDGAAEVRIFPGVGRVAVEVVDRGDGFPYRLLLQGRDETTEPLDCGLRRMQSLVDEVSIRPNLPRGTVVTLAKAAAA